ncbi:MAG: Ribosomal protein L23 [Candidatus Methanohalarchaeum thermophilum]|uniref:Large ribosomal subunit protein uL23 n=1 Tax=Methanohalarchaeum thermophilum TaxID=1903181 RepID=A0A1Q6DX25_METT1|nr:MAG: Ribosomal protein L23 [Candidatus Methanohalarchaeum thermophilum]
MTLIKNPLVTEKTTRLMEENNTLTFVVDIDSKKPQIKNAIEETYDVKVEKVNSMITSKGKKKVYVKLAPEFDAEEIAGRIGIF